MLKPGECGLRQNKFRPYSAKLESLRNELGLTSSYRPNRDELGVMVTCCSDEVVELISSYFRTSIGVESIQVIGVDDTATKIAKIHHYNFTRGTSVLIYNTRAGELPLTPKKVEKIIIYEEELISESRDTLKQKTIPRCCPATVVRLVCEGTIEEKIRSFSPKITENKIHGVHALLIDVPEEQSTSRSSSRNARNQKTWQSLLYEEHDKMCPPASPLSVESDSESDFELTPIENYAMKMIKADQIQLEKERKLSSHYKRTKTISWPKQDLFLSSQGHV